MKNIALVGCGHIHTPGFVERLNKRADINVVAVWDHDSRRASDNATALGSKAVESIDEIWQSSDIDAVVICSETDQHERLVNAACAAGKHLFVEKPLGMGADDAFRMAERITAANLLFQTGYFMRGLPAYIFLRDAIKQGQFGDITRIRMSNCHSGSLNDWFTPRWLWMTEPAKAGVGAFGDLGTHVLDIMLWLIDSPVSSATASLGTANARYGADCDEYGEGLLRFANGTIGSIAAGWVDVADPIKLTLSGTEGHAYVTEAGLFLKTPHIEGADGQQPWAALPKMQPHAFELFLDAINGTNQNALVSPEEAARRNDIMEAMYLAADAKQWVAPKRG